MFPAHDPGGPPPPDSYGMLPKQRDYRAFARRQGDTTAVTFEPHLDTAKTEAFLPLGKAITAEHARAANLLLGAILVDDNQTLMFDSVSDRHLRVRKTR
ncbi:MAG: hypothetical protein JWM91_917 [Rhodospirillales bacterium]|nr:hypothetical protein [Rhodospirillales bacterium]